MGLILKTSGVLLFKASGILAMELDCCCGTCCICPEFPCVGGTVTLTLTGAITGSVDIRPSVGPGDCFSITKEFAITGCDGSLGTLAEATFKCTETNGYELLLTAPEAADCAFPAISPPDSFDCGPPFTATWTISIIEIIEGLCPCAGETVTATITETCP